MTKSILITGCSTGIGLHAAETLHEKGYQVFATARTDEDLAKLKRIGVHPVKMELTDLDSIDAGFSFVMAQTNGRLDYLFNNGAYGQPGAVEDLTTEVLKKQFDTNVFGWHHLTCKALKVMRQQGEGRIIQNSSVLGFVCMPFRGAYNASKFAIEGLTDTLRLELKGSNIHISLIEPGPILSQFRANALKAFKQNVAWENSFHANQYQLEIERMAKTGAAAPFTLPPEAVTRALLHALESKRPKIRYRVTFPTRLFAVLKRFLSARALDRLLSKG